MTSKTSSINMNWFSRYPMKSIMFIHGILEEGKFNSGKKEKKGKNDE
jgi:hypothetical protein